ncbi:unnamed protein product [Rotaria sp. Silwood1]|nr:unnamed protein product [Rotaria sp. Silwood1]
MMMTSNHPSPVRDFIRVNFGPICTSTGIQLSNMIRGKGTGAEVAGLSGSMNFYTLIRQPDQEELLKMFNGAMTIYSI